MPPEWGTGHMEVSGDADAKIPRLWDPEGDAFWSYLFLNKILFQGIASSFTPERQAEIPR